MIAEKQTHIVVLGAGFGGLTFCQVFDHPTARVTLVDRQNHHLFQPLLYQVATAGLSAPEIAQPIRSILCRKPNVTVLLDEAIDVSLPKRCVVLKTGALSYDYLVLALGGVTSYFGHRDWERMAPGLKSLDDALSIRRNILLAFERAENATDPAEQLRLMTIVVVGGGPTGVELAGAFAELARHVLKADFRRIDPTKARVILIEGASRILLHLPPKLSQSAANQLAALGVQVRTDSRVQNILDGCVELETGAPGATSVERIHAENIIWAAGISAHCLTRKLGIELDRAGSVKVNPDLSLPGHPEVFAIGDLALVMDRTGKPVPGVSPAAMQMGRHAAKLIQRELEAGARSSRPAFQYFDKGTMATIGRSAAVAKIGKLEFSGFFAWLAWLFVHLLFLIGFRNKAAVLLQWSYSYFAYKRGARIITRAQRDVDSSPRQESPPLLK
jgi:NADH:quinone reductase (non-electrogenic)